MSAVFRYFISFTFVFSLNISAYAQINDAPVNPSSEATLTVTGEARIRYESLDGQFRSDGIGSDQLLLFRTLMLIEADTTIADFGIEFQDSRTYLADSGSPLSSSIANPLDILQLYTRLNVPGVLGESADLTVGRQTVSIGSKRQIERVSFANVIKSYTGLYYDNRADNGDEFHALYVVPVGRFPDTRPELDDNGLSGDEEQWNRHIWGLHYRRADALPNFADNIWLEAFVYGLNEDDSSDVPTPNRQYVGPGARAYRKPAAGQWDMDIEGVWRFGSRRASSAETDVTDLDVSAQMLFSAVGYTFDHEWYPRIALEYYFSSGDDDPGDLRFDQYERLFGSRRTDLNNTSIHGPLTPANLSAPGFRVQITPTARINARLHFSSASLSSNTDSWVIARLSDSSGQSGSHIGQTWDSRFQYWLIPDRLQLELGASYFAFGDFAKTVANGPEGDSTTFGYGALLLEF